MKTAQQAAQNWARGVSRAAGNWTAGFDPVESYVAGLIEFTEFELRIGYRGTFKLAREGR